MTLPRDPAQEAEQLFDPVPRHLMLNDPISIEQPKETQPVEIPAPQNNQFGNAIPEPSSLLLVGLGILAMIGIIKRMRQ